MRTRMRKKWNCNVLWGTTPLEHMRMRVVYSRYAYKFDRFRCDSDCHTHLKCTVNHSEPGRKFHGMTLRTVIFLMKIFQKYVYRTKQMKMRSILTTERML